MYHCHVEATEHMQMGMLGSLYVHAAQDQLASTTFPNGQQHIKGVHRYAYNDGDGSTRYDKEYPIQMGSFDPDFHDASETVQPLPFAAMKDKYFMLNGRGYPDTVDTGAGPTSTDSQANGNGDLYVGDAQPENALIEAVKGERILLRLSNLNITTFNTLGTVGIPMLIVGKDARLLRGDDGMDQYYRTNSVTLGGGESVDAILETADVEPGTYFLYSTNLHYLANGDQNFGGMMTHIVISGS